MHFPPGDDGDEILAPTDADAESLLNTNNEAQKGLTAGQATFTNWTEPALRSDRMCWSLIGAAHTLAYELGLFGSFADSTLTTDPRAQRLERLLYIYISQTSGRLGLASMFRDIPQESDFAYLQQTLFQRKCALLLIRLVALRLGTTDKQVRLSSPFPFQRYINMSKPKP